MGFRINTNVASLNAQRNAAMTNRQLDNSLGRLSSGLRITKAADDASGLVIADSLRTQASSLAQAVRNGNDAIGIIQTADGALDEYSKILDTIKTKAVQAASDGQNTNSRQAIQKDIDRLMEELNIIATTTSFNGQKLLGGSYTNKEFQLGSDSNQTIKASINSTETAKVGQTTRSRLDVGSDQGGVIQLTVTSASTGKEVTMKAIDIQANNNVKNGMGALANEINANSGETGIRAEAIVSTTSGSAILAGSTGSDFSVNGITIGAVVVEANDGSGTLLAAINGKTTQTGVSASLTTDGRLQLDSNDGRAIEVTGGISGVTGSSGKSMSTLGYIELVQAGASEFQVTGVGTGAVTNDLTLNGAVTTVKDSVIAAGSTLAAGTVLKVGSELGGNVTTSGATASVVDSTLKAGSTIATASTLDQGSTIGGSVTTNATAVLKEDAFYTTGSTLGSATILGAGTVIQQDFTDGTNTFTKGQVLGADFQLTATLTLTADMTNVFTAGGTMQTGVASTLQANSVLGADQVNNGAVTLSQDMILKTGSSLATASVLLAGSTAGGDMTTAGSTATFQDATLKAGSSIADASVLGAGSTIGGAVTVDAIAAGSFTEDMLVKAGSTIASGSVLARGTQLNQDVTLAGVDYKAGDTLEQDRTVGAGEAFVLSEDMVLVGSTTAALGQDSILQTNTENSGAVGLSETEFQTLSNIDVTTLDGAMKAMDTVDAAIKDINNVRADLGSTQNQIVATVNNISVTQVNVKAAESQIRDVDFAAESANFARLNILAQSGSYALSQANAVQQNVLRLLQ
ncbi:flagellin [Sulfurimonas sp. MAG313]|nr:flagellin [Sulfurimonas sp. MAG313]MDF1881776.1 flagellin [Sulfurimonas sp. MAG313]